MPHTRTHFHKRAWVVKQPALHQAVRLLTDPLPEEEVDRLDAAQLEEEHAKKGKAGALPGLWCLLWKLWGLPVSPPSTLSTLKPWPVLRRGRGLEVAPLGRCLTVDGDEVQPGTSTESREAGQGLEVPFVLFKPCGSQRGELGRFDPSSLGVDALAVRRRVGVVVHFFSGRR